MYGYVQRSKLINSNAFTTHFPLGMCMTWGTCDKPIAHATLVSKPQHPKDPGPLFRKEHEIPTVMMAAFQQPGEAQKDSKRSSSVINISAKLYIYMYFLVVAIIMRSIFSGITLGQNSVPQTGHQMLQQLDDPQ